MSDHADVIRERMGVCLALHGDRDDCPACVSYREGQAALDALVAERDEWASKAQEYLAGWNTATNRAEKAEAERDSWRTLAEGWKLTDDVERHRA